MPSATSTITETPEAPENPRIRLEASTSRQEGNNITLQSLGDPEPGIRDENRELTNVSRVQQRWNSPASNTWKTAAVYLALFNCGANDASYGVCLSL